MTKTSAPKKTSTKDKTKVVPDVEDVSVVSEDTSAIDNGDLLSPKSSDSTVDVETGDAVKVSGEDISKEKSDESTDTEPLKVGREAAEVPKVDNNAPLNIEGLTTNHEVPVMDKSAKLKFEDEQEKSDLIGEKTSKMPIFLGAVGVAITLAAIAGFYFVFIAAKPKAETVSQSQVTTTKSPDESPKSKITRGEWSFEVLNGSGVAGAAKTIASKLEESGYKIVKTGNADKSNYDKTTLFVASSLKDKEELVLGDLKDILGSVESGGELKDSTASARIVVGKNN